MVQSGLDIRGVPLRFTRSDPGKLSAITIGFEVREPPKSEGRQKMQQMGEILINFPAGFRHQVDALSHVEVERKDLESGTGVSPGMYLNLPNWLDYTARDRWDGRRRGTGYGLYGGEGFLGRGCV